MGAAEPCGGGAARLDRGRPLAGTVATSLIVNADDLGQCEGINRGIVAARVHGIVTSASLMVRWPDAARGAREASDAGIGLGLHLDLGEWAFRDGDWVQLYDVVDLQDGSAVRDEIARQLNGFVALVGLPPTHIDSHQHVHQRDSIKPFVMAAAEVLAVPVRGCDPRVRHCGGFYGQTGEGDPLPDQIAVESLLGMLSELPDGVTELGCHPGFDVALDTMYRSERVTEVATLCDERVRKAIDAFDIRLCTFEDR